MDFFNDGESKLQATFAAVRDRLFRPLVLFLHRFKITPNKISTLSVIFAVLAASASPSIWYVAVCFMFLSLLMDALDGPLARLTDQQSRGGSLVDIFCDHIGIVIISVGAVFWLGVLLPTAIAFSFFYIHVIYMFVIAKEAKILTPPVVRVKYPYFAIYLFSLAVDTPLYLDFFHAFFGCYYLILFFVFFSRVSKEL